MQYFYLKIEQAQSGVKARVGGVYRDDILLALLPEGEACIVFVVPSDSTVRALRLDEIADKLQEKAYSVCGTKKLVELIRPYGPGRGLSREPSHIILFQGEEPPANLNPKNPEGAYAVAKLNIPDGNIIEVPDASRLRPLIAHSLIKLLSQHLRKADRTRLQERANEIFKRAVDGVVATASLTGITVNNFPGPHPGLCTLWFVTGEELTLSRRTEVAQSPPLSMQIGEIILTNDWTVEFREKAGATPGLLAAYLRIGVRSAKAACGCVSLLVSTALSLIPAAICGGQWWLLPAGCLAGMVVFVLGSSLLLKMRRKSLDRLRREKSL